MRYFTFIIVLLWLNVAHAQVIGAPSSVKLATNLVTGSTNIGGSGWTIHSSTSVTNTTTAAPDGSNTATLITNTATTSGDFPYIGRAITTSTTTKYMVSGWVQAGTGCCIDIGLSNNTSNAFSVLFTFSGTSFQNSTAGNGVIETSGYYPYPNSWYRIWVCGHFSGSPGSQLVSFGPWNNLSGDITNAKTYIVWGVQPEVVPTCSMSPTTFMPT